MGATLLVVMALVMQKPELVVTDYKVQKVEGIPGAFNILGRAKNVSDKELRSIVINITFEDKGGSLIDSTTTFFDRTTLKPGDVGQFKGQYISSTPFDYTKLLFATLAGEEIPHKMELTEPKTTAPPKTTVPPKKRRRR